MSVAIQPFHNTLNAEAGKAVERRKSPFIPGWLDDYKLRTGPEAGRKLNNLEMRILIRVIRRGNCWDSVPDLAKEFEAGDKRIRATLKVLAEEGLILGRERWDRKGGRRSNEYQFTGCKPPCSGRGTPLVRELGAPGFGNRGKDTPFKVSPNKDRSLQASSEGADTSLEPIPATEPDLKAGSFSIYEYPFKQVDPLNDRQPINSQALKRGVATQATNPHTEFIKRWCDMYEKKFGHKYMLHRVKDGAAVKQLLEFDTVSGLLEILSKAWAQTDAKKAWNCVKRTSDIASFATALNQIRGELVNPKIKRETYKSCL